MLAFGYIWYTAFLDNYLDKYPADQAEVDRINRTNWWRGIISSCIFLCSFSYLNPSDYAYFHPMQRFWRVVSMLAQVYFCFVIIMLNHRPEYGRQILQFMDPKLKVPLTTEFHTYDDNCELTWENLWDNFDHYYLVHWGDWFLSSFVIRDFWILHAWHIIDELIELSWQHILPHFRECWWDHILVDITLSNIPAVTLGLWVQSKIGLIRYDFLGKEGKNSIFEWDVWHCQRRFGVFWYIQVLLHVFFINGFFQINNFIIPPIHPFPVMRLLLWFALGSIGFREGYEDARTWNTIERKYTPVEGRYRWLATGILATEAICCWKYRMGTGHIQHNAETPFYIWGPWALAYGGMGVFWLYLRFKEGHTVKYPVEEGSKKSKRVKHE